VVQELNEIPGEVDLLLLGAGAAGLTAALTGAALGLQVVLVEKTDKVGGTSAFSAGSVWVPNTRHSPPGSDDFDNALTYLRQAVGNRLDETRAAAFLREGPAMVDFLEDRTGVRLRAYPYHPDYLATLDGATTNGRVLEPVPFDARVLGRRFGDIRPPLPEFTLFGGMMVDRTDIGHLMAATRSPSSLLHALRLVARYGLDRLRYPRGTRLVMGNALIGRLYHALLQQGATVLLSTEAESLITTNRSVSGAVLTSGGTRRSIQARAGVVLATGGFSRNPDLRRQLIPDIPDAASPLVASATGDGLALAETAGGHLGPQHQNNSFWAPVSRRHRRDGSTAVFPHFVLDRGKPGAIAVDPDGRRFVNEATSYHRFGAAMIAALKGSGRDCCHLLCDDTFIEKYGLGMVRPRRLGLRDALRDGYIVAAASLAELADKIGVPADALAVTVERHNGFAESGVDSDFGKGEDAYQRNLGDPGHGPNPCIGAMTEPPFYALEILPGDIGASVGLVTDEKARVVDGGGNPIRGLYACGNDMESIMAGHYPGPGITIGPGMTFGYVAAVDAAAMATQRPQG
jgi:succinate dehydrogenase/fumarate reductase flavoprotein subunit